MAVIPTTEEILQSALTPRVLKNIHQEHEASRIAANTHHIVEINKNQLRLQMAYAEQQVKAQVCLLESKQSLQRLESGQASMATQTHAFFERMGNDIRWMCETLEQIQVTTEAELKQLNATLIDGFNLVIGELQRSTEIQIESARLLGEVRELLASPTEVHLKELTDRADAQFDRCVGLHNENRSDNLRDCLQLYRAVVANPLGALDYLVWFQIGWIELEIQGNPSEAVVAFNNAQRLSEARGDSHFRSKALRSLAQALLQQGDHEKALSHIKSAIALIPVPADAHHEAAQCCMRKDDHEQACWHIEQAIALRPSLYLNIANDPEFNHPAVISRLMAMETQQVHRLRHSAAMLGVSLSSIAPMITYMGEGRFQDLQSLPGQGFMMEIEGNHGYVACLDLEKRIHRALDALHERVLACLEKARRKIHEDEQQCTERLVTLNTETEKRRQVERGEHQKNVASLTAEANKHVYLATRFINRMEAMAKKPVLIAMAIGIGVYLSSHFDFARPFPQKSISHLMGAAYLFASFFILLRCVYEIRDNDLRKKADEEIRRRLPAMERRHEAALEEIRKQGFLRSFPLEVQQRDKRSDIAIISEWTQALRCWMQSVPHPALDPKRLPKTPFPA